jgi:DnaK suppressor protein
MAARKAHSPKAKTKSAKPSARQVGKSSSGTAKRTAVAATLAKVKPELSVTKRPKAAAQGNGRSASSKAASQPLQVQTEFRAGAKHLSTRTETLVTSMAGVEASVPQSRGRGVRADTRGRGMTTKRRAGDAVDGKGSRGRSPASEPVRVKADATDPAGPITVKIGRGGDVSTAMKKTGEGGASAVQLPNGYRPSDSEPFMNERQRTYFRNKLIAWKEEIIRLNRETLQGLHEDSAQHADVADRATFETDRALELRARDRQRKLIAKIDAAIARIEDGSYGYCEETGEPISLKRLDARPIATLSIEAQERHERRERVFREE